MNLLFKSALFMIANITALVLILEIYETKGTFEVKKQINGLNELREDLEKELKFLKKLTQEKKDEIHPTQ